MRLEILLGVVERFQFMVGSNQEYSLSAVKDRSLSFFPPNDVAHHVIVVANHLIAVPSTT